MAASEQLFAVKHVSFWVGGISAVDAMRQVGLPSMSMTETPYLVEKAVQGVPVYRETHALKSVFAVERLWKRYSHWPNTLRTRVLHLRESVLGAPYVEGLIHERLACPHVCIPERRWRQNIEIGLYPIAYLSVIAWHRAEGIEKIVATYMDAAVATIEDLGHSWTIWCSFHEALPYLASETSRLYAAERFAEFVSQQFHRSGRTRAGAALPACEPIEAPPISVLEVISEALERPGFLGHHLITLATLLRHRALLTDQQFSVGLHRIRGMLRFCWDDPEFDITVEQGTSDSRIDDLSSADPERQLLKLLEQGSDNVHTLTLADAVAGLWDHADHRQRAGLLRCLDRFLVLDSE